MNLNPFKHTEPTIAPAIEGDHSHEKSRMSALVIGCIGVVYGDIGTSPLYAFREAAHQISDDGIRPEEIYGILSLLIWALIIIVTLKYVLFLLKMDNRGEGGILSLMALAQKAVGKNTGIIFLAGVAGAALFYGDSVITPAISVLSAVEGLKLVTPAFNHSILPISMGILVLLFAMQKYGTAKVSILFGPITAIWFLAMAVSGTVWIVKNPIILSSLLPTYGLSFLLEHGWLSLAVLGAVFLAVTGAEALYADLGHFGRKPIQIAWIWFVCPALTLNYLGQGALLLENPNTIDNPFYYLVPEWALLPMVILATLATIVAAQAVITGAFSLTSQAIQLGLLPRMEIRHTSAKQEGQIYMPRVNTYILIGVLLLCVTFQNSSNLASAYGIAVTGTMIASTILSFVVFRHVFGKGPLVAGLIIAPFLIVELVFMSANMMKLLEGGFVPLILGLVVVLLMSTWVSGTRYLYKMAHRKSVPVSDLAEMLDRETPPIIPGTAIFLTSDPQVAPETLMQNLKHNFILHEKNIILTVSVAHIPKIPENQRLMIEPISSHFTRVVLNFGFMETPDVTRALYQAAWQGFDIDVENASFFLGRRKIVSDPRHGLPGWQDKIYISMSKSAVEATDFYRIPANQVIEIGTRVVV